MEKHKNCKDCTPYETRLMREGKVLGFTKEQIDWLCENFSFVEEDYE